MIFFVLSTTSFVLALFVIYWLHSQYHLDIRVEIAPAPDATDLISVCVPARDEERNIRACIQSILAQTYPKFEVIVVDDESKDATLEILAQMEVISDRLTIIHGTSLPASWAGKPFALNQASAASQGSWLCFVDADTVLEPQALSSCFVKALETGADLFTVMTHQIMGSFWEKVVMPLVMTALSVGFSPRRVNDPATDIAVANGQFILIKRAVYDQVGGHNRIKDKIVEDKALAELVKWNGYRLILADGSALAHTRMYTSLLEMWEGWTKNIYLGLRDQKYLLWLGTFGAILSVIAALLLPDWPWLGLIWWRNGGGWLAVTVIAQAVLVWLVVLFTRGATARRMGIPAWYAWTTPLGAGIFAAMMFASTWKVVSGTGVSWKGRSYIPSKH